MDMKRLILSILFVFSTFWGYSQGNKAAKFKGAYNIYPVDSVGVVLLNRSLRQLSNGELALEFKGLGPDLSENWKNLYPFSRGMSPVFQDISAGGIVILFADKSRKQYELIKASADYGEYARFKYNFSEPLQVSELESYYDEIWVAGLIGDSPAVFKLRPDNSYVTVPTGTPGLLKYVGELAYDKSVGALNFIMLTAMGNKDVLTWRSLTLSGKPLKNELLNAFDRKSIRSVKATYTKDKAFISGTFSNNSRQRIDGIFWGEINEQNGLLKTRSLKEVKALSSYKPLGATGEREFGSIAAKKFRGANKVIFLDDIQVSSEGKPIIALEVYKPEFRNRGALEKEFVARDRTAQLDQNVYGRRDAFFGDSQTRDLEGRINTYSATDQLQFRFMDQSLGKAVNQGVSYSHTVVINLDEKHKVTEAYGVSFNIKDFGGLARSQQFANGKLSYPAGNRFWQFDTGNKRFKSLQSAENAALIKWTNDSLLEVAFDKEDNQITLLRRRFN